MPDTIASIATGDNISAIGIIRISGPDALTASDNIFRAKSGLRLVDFETKKMYYGEVYSENGLIDLCLCFISRAPHSYTGEDTVEFYCHGAPVVLIEILNTLIKNGVRLALPGEYTKRAFLNGKMDLTQVEAVIDLIEAKTSFAARIAAGQLSGAVSGKMESVYNKLIDISSHFHAVIDYPDEDIDDFKVQNYFTVLNDIHDELIRLYKTHERGMFIRDGIPTAIIGRPNTGKSSLLNALVGFDRAIVTDIEGTTRDTIEEKVIIGDVLLRLIDTAGLRRTNDTIEQLGVDRTFLAIKDAGLVIMVIDGSEELKSEDYEALEAIPVDIPVIVVINKSDLPTALEPQDIEGLGLLTCMVSALSGEGLDKLGEKIKSILQSSGKLFDKCNYNEILTNSRQADAIYRAAKSVSRAATALTASVTPDAIITDIEAALSAIGEVTGKTIREDIITRIFDRFCVGK